VRITPPTKVATTTGLTSDSSESDSDSKSYSKSGSSGSGDHSDFFSVGIKISLVDGGTTPPPTLVEKVGLDTGGLLISKGRSKEDNDRWSSISSENRYRASLTSML